MSPLVTITTAKRLSGTILVPGDKSISHRGVIFGSIARGKTRLKNFLMGEDCISTIRAFREMGISTEILKNNTVIIEGKGLRGLTAPLQNIDAGNSGTTARLLLGLLAGQSFQATLIGDESLQKRPMDRVVIPLKKMGAIIKGAEKESTLPLTIQGGKLKGIEYTMPVASAQVKSALILATMYAETPSKIHQPAPSRDHTEIMLKAFGGRVDSTPTTITAYPAQELYAQDIYIPGDISSAAYFITAALIVPNSVITIKNVGLNPSRTGILDVYRAMGAHINIENYRVSGGEPIGDITVKSSSLKGVTIEGELIPRLIDEIPIIALAATQATGTTVIRDAEELKVKESNRIDSVVSVLKTMGADIEATEDGMIINGPTALLGQDIYAGTDHRIVMMGAIAALIAEGNTNIHGARWADISYPGFFNVLREIKESS